MSLVGPRPHSLEDHEAYSSLIKTYMVRHLVKPGITGLAQIRGWKGPLDQMHMQMRVRYDVEYLENWRFSLDLEIIWRSLWVMLRGAQSISDPNQ
jgi:Sugar transferases involved in lipopolysaccharide synthesis